MERIIEPITFDISRKAPDIAFDLGVSVTGGGTTEGAVRYDIAQNLTEYQQAQAVENIGMKADSMDAMQLLSDSGFITPMYENGVFYTAETGEIFVI